MFLGKWKSIMKWNRYFKISSYTSESRGLGPMDVLWLFDIFPSVNCSLASIAPLSSEGTWTHGSKSWTRRRIIQPSSWPLQAWSEWAGKTASARYHLWRLLSNPNPTTIGMLNTSYTSNCLVMECPSLPFHYWPITVVLHSIFTEQYMLMAHLRYFDNVLT